MPANKETIVILDNDNTPRTLQLPARQPRQQRRRSPASGGGASKGKGKGKGKGRSKAPPITRSEAGGLVAGMGAAEKIGETINGFAPTFSVDVPMMGQPPLDAADAVAVCIAYDIYAYGKAGKGKRGFIPRGYRAFAAGFALDRLAPRIKGILG